MNEPALRIKDSDGFYEYLLDAAAARSVRVTR